MMKRKILLIIFLTISSQFLVAGISFSAPSINRFNISPSTISLPDQDPDLYTEVISTPDLFVDINIGGMKASQSWILEIYSNLDLTSGADIIPIGNVRWTVTGSGTPPANYYNGTFSKGVYLPTVGATGNTNQQIYFKFYLQNSWTYATGNYSVVITLRLTVPGQVQYQTFTLSSTINARAKLEFGMLTLNFPDRNPDSFPSITANENPVNVTSSARTGSSLTAILICLASGDLISGTNSIPISNITWQSTGSGYVAGTMSKTAQQTTGSWTGSGKRTGTLSYFLTNSWSYTTGNYSQTIVYGLSAP
jgi:hypothetical protein